MTRDARTQDGKYWFGLGGIKNDTVDGHHWVTNQFELRGATKTLNKGHGVFHAT